MKKIVSLIFNIVLIVLVGMFGYSYMLKAYIPFNVLQIIGIPVLGIFMLSLCSYVQRKISKDIIVLMRLLRALNIISFALLIPLGARNPYLLLKYELYFYIPVTAIFVISFGLILLLYKKANYSKDREFNLININVLNLIDKILGICLIAMGSFSIMRTIQIITNPFFNRWFQRNFMISLFTIILISGIIFSMELLLVKKSKVKVDNEN